MFSVQIQKTLPFIPGLILNWEINVGNSNTRWHWATLDNTPEPAIPWDAHLFPGDDLSPVSYFEANVLYNYTTGKNNFLYVNNFLPFSYSLRQDYYLNLSRSAISTTGGKYGNGVYETAIWPMSTQAQHIHCRSGFIIRGQFGPQGQLITGYVVFIDTQLQIVGVERWSGGSSSLIASWSITSTPTGIAFGWNMLRAVVINNEIWVYFNPTHTDALNGGIKKNARIYILDKQPLSDGQGALLNAYDNTWTSFDYFSITDIRAF